MTHAYVCMLKTKFSLVDFFQILYIISHESPPHINHISSEFKDLILGPLEL